ncbi:MAG: hypothetical protein A2Y00_03055 [Omnitrophica WOR_2 bacterium GWF2_43_52]|nr:MAG: hypothetical protein A2062_01065 [Omnitrophica WOR_2 bacterium GWA2_44_7]OGX22413.1 MAG: hypothetical protein A2Y00_03055 [Omnitrophica WOR_2 bacterium GWF2_43_52]
MEKQILAFVPARGGSKRLPGKNIKLLGGIPLLAYSLIAALNSRIITKIVLSSDDDTMLAIGGHYGRIEGIRRPDSLSDDKATTLSAIAHCLEYLEVHQAYRPDIVVLLQPTCPFRENGYIDAAINCFLESDAHSLIGVCEEKYKLGEIRGKYFYPQYKEGTRKQDMPAVYRENGSIYISRSHIIKEGTLFGKKILPYLGNKFNAVNIDTQLDFDSAEMILEKYADQFKGGAIQ